MTPRVLWDFICKIDIKNYTKGKVRFNPRSVVHKGLDLAHEIEDIGAFPALTREVLASKLGDPDRLVWEGGMVLDKVIDHFLSIDTIPVKGVSIDLSPLEKTWTKKHIMTYSASLAGAVEIFHPLNTRGCIGACRRNEFITLVLEGIDIGPPHLGSVLWRNSRLGILIWPAKKKKKRYRVRWWPKK